MRRAPSLMLAALLPLASFACAPRDLGCWEGEYAVDSAADVEALEGYSCIDGTLWIRAGSRGLEQIELVTGSLQVTGDGDLVGLTGLRQVDGGLVIRSAQAEDLGPLAALESTFSIRLWDMPALKTLEGLPALELEYFTLDELPALETLQGAEGLDLEGGVLRIENVPVSDLTPLGHVRELTTLTIEGSPNLDFSGLSSLERVESFELLRFTGDDLEGLVGLREVGSIEVFGGTLKTFAGLEQVDTLRSLWIHDIEHMDALSGLSSVRTLEILNLTDTGVADFSGLEQLESVQNILLRRNAGLENLSGLSGLRTLSTLEANENPALRSLEGLGPL
ncbi:MAG: hypothetical protein KC457_18905, partial [Myxococcales bacterium]|nr:hypothetical protein [Myxococcales bacterium]